MRILLVALFIANSVFSINTINKDQDLQNKFSKLCQKLQSYQNASSLYEVIPGVAKEFFGVHYVSCAIMANSNAPHTHLNLEEELEVDLEAMDCFTFVENTLALSLVLQDGKCEYNAFKENLRKIRYRDGQIDGYASRLHYFSDWAVEQTIHNILVEKTKDLEGVQTRLNINYMTRRAPKNPALADENTFKQIKNLEQKLSTENVYFIPREKVPSVLKKLKTGDLVAFTAAEKEGIDVYHTGFVWKVGKEVHLLHANSSLLERGVVVSSNTMGSYLLHHHKFSGIRVFSWIR